MKSFYLATKNSTSVFHNPPIANAPLLLGWFDKNAEVVGALLREEAYENTDILLPPPSPDMIIPVANAIKSLEHIKGAWVSGTLQLLPTQEKLWYSSCRTCNTSVSSYIAWEFTCTSCGARAPVQQKNVPLIREIEAGVYKKPVTCFVKYYDKTYRGSSLRMYPVQKMYLQPDVPRGGDENINSLLNDEGSLGNTNTAAQSIATDNHLFSPNTKKILEEIGGIPPRDETCSGSSVAAKRSMFESLTKAPAIVTSSNVAAVAVEKPVQGTIASHPRIELAAKNANEGEQVSGVESPIKKCRSKEKEC